MDTVRRVKVYAAKQPGDDESAKGMLYFRKWVKVRAVWIPSGMCRAHCELRLCSRYWSRRLWTTT
ncbi:hypothetical protein CALVIDRAFT_532708 [Calocera viscosa TUFC12733]|uniref:Uncharacterized protein n=1 Tax=Calocera viscosa (strain TUFC12733) TaxID=1330018 RepID=A0A167RN77_CALVF|nr:hypothetical protein CALVIDRAFT_532708 [Calocera viscosa TUFC12733]